MESEERVRALSDQLRRTSSVRMPTSAKPRHTHQKRPRTASQSASALPALADAGGADEGSLDSRPPGTAPVGSRSMSQRQKDALNHLVKMVAEHDALLEGLPVVRVEDWAAVTPAFLDDEWARIQGEVTNGTISWTKAYFPYWFAQYTKHMSPPRPR